MSTPVCWEQKVFLVVNTPFNLISTVSLLALSPIYLVFGLLRVPLAVLLLLMSAIFAVLLACIFGLSKAAMSSQAIRPFAFVLALPLLVLAHFVVSISPSPTPADAQAKHDKWAFIEAFPYSSLLLKEEVGGET